MIVEMFLHDLVSLIHHSLDDMTLLSVLACFSVVLFDDVGLQVAGTNV
jgi:hypothetical protein